MLLCYPQALGLDELVEAINLAGEQTGASLHVNGIDPGWANDVLPLALTSLSQRIDLVRVSEIADYSTYYQPVVMRTSTASASRWTRSPCCGSRAS